MSTATNSYGQTVASAQICCIISYGGRETADVEPVLHVLYQILSDYELMRFRLDKTQNKIKNLVKPAVMSEISFLV